MGRKCCCSCCTILKKRTDHISIPSWTPLFSQGNLNPWKLQRLIMGRWGQAIWTLSRLYGRTYSLATCFATFSSWCVALSAKRLLWKAKAVLKRSLTKGKSPISIFLWQLCRFMSFAWTTLVWIPWGLHRFFWWLVGFACLFALLATFLAERVLSCDAFCHLLFSCWFDLFPPIPIRVIWFWPFECCRDARLEFGVTLSQSRAVRPASSLAYSAAVLKPFQNGLVQIFFKMVLKSWGNFHNEGHIFYDSLHQSIFKTSIFRPRFHIAHQNRI